MKNLRSFLIVSIVMLIVSCGIAPSSFAQDLDDQPPTTAELEQFRADLSQTIQNLNASVTKMQSNPAVRDAIAKSGKNPVQASAAAQKQLEKLSYQELEQLYRAYNAKFPNWREKLGAMEQIAEKIGGNYSGTRHSKGGTGGDAITPDDCQIAYNAAPSWEDWVALKESEIGAQVVYEATPPVLNLIPLAVWAPIAIGGVISEYQNNLFDRCSGDAAAAEVQASLTNIKNTVISFNQQIQENADSNTTRILDRFTTSFNGVKTEIINNDNTNKTTILTAVSSAQNAVINSGDTNLTTTTTAITNSKNEIISNDNSNKTTIVNNDNSNAATLNNNLTNARNTIINNDNTNMTNIVNNNNANTTTLNTAITNAKTDIINNAAANKTELRDLLLRSQIEADLATESNGVKVAWYMTPTANGGHLDLVQQIVTLTLANIRAAGGSIGTAQSFLDRANADKAAGNFKSAYDNYRKAYKAAAN